MALPTECVNGFRQIGSGSADHRAGRRATPDGVAAGPGNDLETIRRRPCHAAVTPVSRTPGSLGHLTQEGGDSMINISMSELEVQSAELLPEKETLYFNNNWAGVYASNTSMAINAATLGSIATSGAWQSVAVSQG
jgi:hypothetical protein